MSWMAVLLGLLMVATIDVSLGLWDVHTGMVMQDDPATLKSERRDIRGRREVNTNMDGDEDGSGLKDNHTYYTSEIFHPEDLDQHWIELQDDSRHHTLSNSFNYGNWANATFEFPFYGHPIHRIMITTSGFISTSSYAHTAQTSTQYISAYMLDYNPSILDKSSVYFETMGDKFVVEWRNLYIYERDHHTETFFGPFSFQTIVHKNGTILFLYKEVPGIFNDIKVGLADGAAFDTHNPNMKQFWNYGSVMINSSLIHEGTVIRLNPLPTCNLAKDCQTCVTQDIPFDCQWCDATSRCSDGVDRWAHDWNLSGCFMTATSVCKTTHTNHTTPRTSTTRVAKQSTTTSISETTSRTTAAEQPTTSRLSETFIPRTHANDETETSAQPFTSTRLSGTRHDISTTMSQERETPSKTPFWKHTRTSPIAAHNTRSMISANDGNVAASSMNRETGRKNDDTSNTGTIIVVVLIAVALITTVGGLFLYAYTHPSSRLAIWLLEHRPSTMVVRFQRRNDQSPGPSDTTQVSKQ